jgi:anti-sigma B factor antagonist
VGTGCHFEIVVREVGGAPVVELHGEIDAAASRDVIGAISKILHRGVPRVTVDLANVTFIDSSGMSALVRVNLQAKALGSQFSLRNAAGNARRALQVCGLIDQLEA